MRILSFTFILSLYLLPGSILGDVPVFIKIDKSLTDRNIIQQKDSVEAETQYEAGQITHTHENRKALPDNNNPNKKSETYDWKKDGLFQALFHVGLNLAQIDGDAYWGYNSVGFDGGVGVLVRFHKYFSTSMELNYAMWGAKYKLIDPSYNLYKVNENYVQIPLSINVHDKGIVMLSAGVNLGYMVYFSQRREDGKNFTDSVPLPKKFDLDVFVGVHFIIKKQFAIGLKFSYSMLPLRAGEQPSRIQNEYNNAITLRFMYILKARKKKQ